MMAEQLHQPFQKDTESSQDLMTSLTCSREDNMKRFSKGGRSERWTVLQNERHFTLPIAALQLLTVSLATSTIPSR